MSDFLSNLPLNLNLKKFIATTAISKILKLLRINQFPCTFEENMFDWIVYLFSFGLPPFKPFYCDTFGVDIYTRDNCRMYPTYKIILISSLLLIEKKI